MIHVPRGPDPLAPDEQRRVVAARVRAMEDVKALGRQQRVQFDDSAWRQYRKHLFSTFQSKCAFCETPLDAGSHGAIAHLRPAYRYPELAYDWTNLYLACHVCNANQGALDPVDPRTGTLAVVDPCSEDPEALFEVGSDGLVVARASLDLQQQARVEKTIAAFGLNRAQLVLARRRVIEAFERRFRAGLNDPNVLHLASAMINSDAPYAAAARDALRYLRQPTIGAPASSRRPKVRRAGTIRPTFISRVEIQGFRLAKSVDISVEPEWLVLLGENGTAKTTILQAIALALMGQRYVRRWPQNVLSVGGTKATEGFIRVHLTTDSVPIEAAFDATGVRFTSGRQGAGTIVRGFGAVRIVGERRRSLPRPPQWVESLFSPRVTFDHPDHWAAQLDARGLDSFGLATKDLLGLPVDARVHVTEGRLGIETHSGEFTYEDLSVGYQSMISLLAELTAAARLTGSDDPANAQAIVLLDELGTHLHPRWKMEVVKAFRRAFPRMQFIVTTHEPLCLRGIKPKEVVLLEREGPGIRVEVDLPDPAAMRVDQLLTSRMFGMQSTIDPAVDAKFRRYYALLVLHNPSSAEELETTNLKAELSQHGVLGYTRRDQMVYEIIDDFLARSPALDQTAREALDTSTRKLVSELWATAAFAARKSR